MLRAAPYPARMFSALWVLLRNGPTPRELCCVVTSSHNLKWLGLFSFIFKLRPDLQPMANILSKFTTKLAESPNMSVININGQLKMKILHQNEAHNLSGLEPKLIKLEFIIYLPKLKVYSQLENEIKKAIEGRGLEPKLIKSQLKDFYIT